MRDSKLITIGHQVPQKRKKVKSTLIKAYLISKQDRLFPSFSFLSITAFIRRVLLQCLEHWLPLYLKDQKL